MGGKKNDGHPSGSLICVEPGCDAVLDNEWAMQEHRYDVHGVTRPRTTYICRQPGCSERFDVEGERNHHEVTTHGTNETPAAVEGPRRIVCAIKGCTDEFGSKQKRGAHRGGAHPGWTDGDLDRSLLDPREVADMSGSGAPARAGTAKKARTPAAKPEGRTARTKRQEQPIRTVEDPPEPEPDPADELEFRDIFAVEPDEPNEFSSHASLLVTIRAADLDALEAMAYLNDQRPEDIVANVVIDLATEARQDDLIVTLLEARASYRDRKREGATR